jgi:hypothetical protein
MKCKRADKGWMIGQLTFDSGLNQRQEVPTKCEEDRPAQAGHVYSAPVSGEQAVHAVARLGTD